jgi:hypothetical protein
LPGFFVLGVNLNEVLVGGQALGGIGTGLGCGVEKSGVVGMKDLA